MPSSWSRLIAALLLCLHSMTGTSLASVLFVTFADLSPAHQVQVELTDAGNVRIRLHHQAAAFTPAVKDHRDVLDRMLAGLCQGSNEGDHLFAQAAANASTSVRPVLRVSDQAIVANEAACAFLSSVFPAVWTFPLVGTQSREPENRWWRGCPNISETGRNTIVLVI